MKRSHGLRNRTRSKLRKRAREKGMPPITHSLREYAPGDRVSIRINPAIHGGMPHPRFQGQTGVVTGKQGRAFVVAFTDGHMAKTLIVAPEHLLKQT